MTHFGSGVCIAATTEAAVLRVKLEETVLPVSPGTGLVELERPSILATLLPRHLAGNVGFETIPDLERHWR